ncbi:solute carrier family 45 member 3 [Pangasianodon hypophthalmus]|uniref:solute carrier family 45 member 3 n=1 Tax=Pangasianodon hypophthalmus TaxID=310915 RepID=UPI002307369C|nr:solute carrier family 45 member 3 [Pangasianodon hypophthalmus]
MRSRLLDLFLVNVLTCGLEICMATSTIYIPPMLLEAGVQERFMTMVLGVGPVLGLIFVPPLGSASDRWNSRYGRRRPFIWALCVGVLLGLVVIPRASQITSLFSEQHQRGLEVLLLVSSICVLQFCSQACFTPLEALVSDLYPGEEESRQAFSIYSIMLSLGGCIGYLLPAVDWTGLGASSYLGGQEAFIYALLTGLFLICLMTTALISEEQTAGVVTESSRRSPSSYGVCCWPFWLFSRAQMLKHAVVSLFAVMPRLWSVCSHIPRVIARLFVAELCSWMALMTFVLFYTDFVGEGLYDGVPSAKPGSPERLRYEEGVRVASLGLFLQCVTSVTFSILMERMVACVGARVLYLSSLALLALSTAVMTVSKNIILVTVMAALTGYTFCTLQILPYTLTCLYHSDKQVFFSRSRPKRRSIRGDLAESAHKQISAMYRNTNGCLNGHAGVSSTTKSPVSSTLNSHVSLDMDTSPSSYQPQRGMCLDIAILDSAYLLSQVVPSLFMGSIVHLFSSVTAYMVCASVLSLLAVIFSSRIVFTRQEMEMLK